MGAVGVGVAAVGTLMEVYGQVKGGIDKANAAKKTAEIQSQQADEVLSREAINEQIMRDQADYQALHVGGAAGDTGIGGRLMIYKNLRQSIQNSNREATFKAGLLREGAQIDTKLASDAITGSVIEGTGSLLKGGYDLYNDYIKYGAPSSKTDSLPGVS